MITCGYCGVERPDAEVAFMAPNGRPGKWTCLVCMALGREMFRRQIFCPACVATAKMLDAALEAQEIYMTTGDMTVIRVTPARLEHREGCPLDPQMSG